MAQRKQRHTHSPRGLDRTHSPEVGAQGNKPSRKSRLFGSLQGSSIKTIWKFEGLSFSRAFGLVLVLCFLVITLATPLRNYFEQRTERSALETSNSQYRLDNQRKQSEIQRWNDPDFLDQETRRRLIVVPRGETAYRVVEPQQMYQGNKDPRQGDTTVHKAGPWYSDLWHDISTPQT